MSHSHTSFEVVDGVGVITLNRPKAMNALLLEQVEYLADLFDDISKRDDIRSVLLKGAGGNFCSGIDLMDAQKEPVDKPTRSELMTTMGPVGRLAVAQFNLDRPIISAIQGIVSGVGLTYAIGCDRRFSDSSARIGAIWMKRAFHPDGGITYTLPKIVGIPTALHMLATGELFNAEDAKAMGLIDELVDDGDDVFEVALAYAKKLADGPSVMMGLARRAVYQGLEGSLEDAIMREMWGITISSQTQDIKEGIRAWVKKRPTNFSGC